MSCFAVEGGTRGKVACPLSIVKILNVIYVSLLAYNYIVIPMIYCNVLSTIRT